MKILIEEYGTVVISAVVGFVIIGIGLRMFVTIKPFVEVYILSLM